jgi:poly(A) polymerase
MKPGARRARFGAKARAKLGTMGTLEPRILERAQHPVSRRDIDRNVLKVLYRLVGAGHVAYLVGGSVRDLMMGRRPKDFDVATSAHPTQVRDLFRNSRLIGRRFRLVHVFFGAQNIEVATFRRRSEEVVEGDDPLIRHDNTFGTAAEDAFRRDFTVNALFYDPATFRVIDFTDGVVDLGAGLIRTVGDPELRMREDPVRMIRAVRFAVKLGFAIEPATYAAMERHRGDLVKAAVPRLVEETFRTLALVGAEQAFTLLERLGILEILLPSIAEHVSRDEPARVHMVANLAALSRLLEAGEEVSRSFVLACLYADYHLSHPREASDDRFRLVDALRHRGYSKADTEQMRLLLDAMGHIANRSRALRRLSRRPYFAEARRLWEMVAPTFGIAPLTLEALLAPPPRPAANAEPGRRRRRRRGGRRRGERGQTPLAGVEHRIGNGAAGSAPKETPPSLVESAPEPAPTVAADKYPGPDSRS